MRLPHWIGRVRSWFSRAPDPPAVTSAPAERHPEALLLSPSGALLDSDEHEFRRLSSGTRFQQRDLTPLQQDRMLEIAWYLWETNPFARRLIQLLTDLVVGEGVSLEASDPRVLEAARKVWDHPINRLGARVREFHTALALNGELILPVAVNDVSGVPVIGFIDPYQVEAVEPRADNVLVPEFIRLKRRADESQPTRLRVVQPNPSSGLLEGDVFYFAINKLPNSSRGRSDYLPVADWLDLFDQFMFAEVERVRLLSTFVWDLTIQNATREQVQERLREIGTPQAGSVFAHNQGETLQPLAPDLKASDRSETARLLQIHTAGSMGVPLSWLGWHDSTRATIEGQNDVLYKTPAARQKEFASILETILRFGLERQRAANPVLFRGVEDDTVRVVMPEIAAKDIARVGQVLAQLVPALDTAMQNRTMSRRIAATIQLALAKHLGTGLEFQADDVLEEADAEHEDAARAADTAHADRARRGLTNPPIPADASDDEEEPAADRAAVSP